MIRQRMPEDRIGLTKTIRIAGAEPMYLTVNALRDGRIGELFLSGKMGEMELALADALCMAISVGLQYGVPPEVFTAKLRGIKSHPAGFTGDPAHPMVSSRLDYIARVIDGLIPACAVSSFIHGVSRATDEPRE